MIKIITFLALISYGCISMAALPVLPTEDQEAWLKHDDPLLEKNKRIAYDFFRFVVRGLRLERTSDFIHEDYIQHNPNVETGMSGLVDFLKSRLGDNGPPPILDALAGLVAVHADGNFVTLSWVLDCNLDGKAYTTTKFDMLRIVDSKVAEHWDSSRLRVPGAPRC